MPTFMKHVTKIERKSAEFIQSPTHVTMLNFWNICVSEFNHCLLWWQLSPPPPSTTTLNNRPLQQPLPFHHHPNYRYDHCCSTNDWHPFGIRRAPPPTAKLSTLPTLAPTPTDHLPLRHFNSTMIPACWPPHLGLSVVLQPRLQTQCLPWAYTRSSSRTGVTFGPKGEFRRVRENVVRMVDSDAVRIFRLRHRHWTAFQWTKGGW